MTDSNQSNTKPTDGHCPKCGADICAQLAEAYDAGRESMEEDEERTGTMACPICGLDSPHQHLTQDVEAWRAKEMAGESSEVIPLCFAKHPTEPLLRCALDCEHAGRDPNDHQWFQFSPESIARREALSGAAQPRGEPSNWGHAPECHFPEFGSKCTCQPAQCKAEMQPGTRCWLTAGPNSDLCWVHRSTR